MTPALPPTAWSRSDRRRGRDIMERLRPTAIEDGRAEVQSQHPRQEEIVLTRRGEPDREPSRRIEAGGDRTDPVGPGGALHPYPQETGGRRGLIGDEEGPLAADVDQSGLDSTDTVPRVELQRALIRDRGPSGRGPAIASIGHTNFPIRLG